MSALLANTETRFVGDDFAAYPHISAFGAFARVVRLNHFRPQDYFAAFNLRVRRGEDLSRCLTFSIAKQDILRRVLCLDAEGTFDIVHWLPFKGGGAAAFEADWQFRYCPCCLRYGYHTLLTQLPWIQRCPWHGVRLRSRCVKCDRPMTLDGAHERRLLMCACGHDAINEAEACYGDDRLTEGAAQFVERYLMWAAKQRDQWEMVQSPNRTTKFGALAKAICLPPALSYRCQDRDRGGKAHVGTVVCRRPSLDTRDLAAAFAKLSILERDNPGVIELPLQMAKGFSAVGCRLARRLPPESLSDAEMSLFFDGLAIEPTRSFKPARRKSIAEIALLPSQLIGNRRFLNISCIGKVAHQCAFYLLQSVLGADFDRADTAVGTQDQGAERLLLESESRILLRAYSEGIRIVLSRHVPLLFDSHRDRPHLTEPWILIRWQGDALVETVLVWAKADRLPD